MKYMLLIQHGDTPVPGTPEWDAFSEDEQKQVYADYQALNSTPGRSSTSWISTATTTCSDARRAAAPRRPDRGRTHRV